MSSLLRLAWLIMPFLLGCASHAQDSTLYVYGSVAEYGSMTAVPRFLVMAIDRRDTSERILARTNARGRYELVLHAPREYAIVYQAVGLMTKHVWMDLRGPDAQQWKGGFAMQVDMVLPPPVEGVDASVLKEPVGRCSFNRATGHFEWDKAYAEEMKPRLAELNGALDKALMPDTLLGPPVVGPEKPAAPPSAPPK